MGEKHYHHKRLACRNVYCTVCKKQTFAEQFRYLVVLTKLTMPILPVGFQKSWRCTECGQNPEASAPTSKLGLFIALVIGAGLSIFSCTLEFPEGQQGTKWGLTVMMALFTLIVLYKYLAEDRQAYDNNLSGVVPLDREKCPFCRGTLEHRAKARCPVCKVDVL